MLGIDVRVNGSGGDIVSFETVFPSTKISIGYTVPSFETRKKNSPTKIDRKIVLLRMPAAGMMPADQQEAFGLMVVAMSTSESMGVRDGGITISRDLREKCGLRSPDPEDPWILEMWHVVR